MRTKIFFSMLLGLIVFFNLQSQEKNITLEDILVEGKFWPDGIWGMNHLSDGQHFSKLEFDRAAQSINIVSYAYEDGKQEEVLFKSSDAQEQYAKDKRFAFYEYQMSPDMDKILLAVDQEQIYRHSSKSDYYIWDREEEKLIDLAEGEKQLYATFSPDGEKVAYVQNNNLFYKNLSSGETVQVTTKGVKNKVIFGASDWVYEEELVVTRAFFWSPDSRRLAFYRFDESAVRQFTMDLYTEAYPERYTFKYPKAGEANSIVSIHSYSIETNTTDLLDVNVKEDHYIPRIKWTQNPEVLSVQRLNRSQNQLDLLLVNVSTGNVTKLFTEENEYYIDITNDLTFLKDGEHFIWTSESDGYNHIYLFNMEGKLEKKLTSGKNDVTKFYGIDEEEGIIYYQSAEESPLERHVYRVNLKGRKNKQLFKDPGTYDANFSEGFKYYILKYSNANTPPTYTMYNDEHEKLRVLEDNKELKETMEEYGFQQKEFFYFTTSEDVQLNGWMIKPMNFDPIKKYPVLMFVYGGPGSQTVRDIYGSRNDFWFQMLAQKGYIVVSVDNRGTGARGEEFKKMVYRNLGYYEAKDQMETAQYLRELEYIDDERIGIFGWSYGGYLSSLALFKYSMAFNLAIAVAPVTSWKFYDTIYTERFMSTPQDNPEGYEQSAPINFVDGLEGDYLLIHGTADDNVHVQNTMELIAALVEAGKQFDMFLYPDQNHAIPQRQASLHLYNLMTDFILENL